MEVALGLEGMEKQEMEKWNLMIKVFMDVGVCGSW